MFEELKGPGLALGVDGGWQHVENLRSNLAPGQIILMGTDDIWEAPTRRDKHSGKPSCVASYVEMRRQLPKNSLGPY